MERIEFSKISEIDLITLGPNHLTESQVTQAALRPVREELCHAVHGVSEWAAGHNK